MPQPASAARIADGANCPSHAGKATISTPDGGAQQAPCSMICRRRAPLSANIRALGAKPAFRIDDDARRLRPGAAPHGQQRIVGDGGADADDDRIHQRPQPMQVHQARRPIDVFRVPGFRRNAAVQRLADLADNDEIVDGALAQRTEHIGPGMRKRLLASTEYIAEVFPGIGRHGSRSRGELLVGTRKSKTLV